VCVPGYAKKVQGVPQEVKQEVYREYGITSYDRGDYEIEVSAQLSWLVGLGVGAQGIFATDPFAAGNPLIVSTIGSPTTCPTKICPSILVRQIRRTDRQELGGIAPNEVVQRMANNFFGIMAAGEQLRMIRKPFV
jgi:hypothetical protein